MTQFIIGYGEVGKALHKIFPEALCFDKEDETNKPTLPKADVIHICFPYSGTFISEVQKYQEECHPEITIIHSSVPIGTSNKLDAVHSPVRGVHPNLEQGVRTFVKYFSGFKAPQAAKLFRDQGIKTSIISDTRTTEAAKLWDTTQYGIMILLEKEIYKFCRDNQLDFEIVYGDFNETYNRGYIETGMLHVMRPRLMHKDGPIGGHCVLENAELLDTPSAKRIITEGNNKEQ